MSSSLLNTVANFETTITAKLAVGGTSLTLSTNVDKDGNTLPDGVYGFTINEGKANEEHVVGTKTGTTVASLVRNVSRIDGTTAQTGKEHKKNSPIKITDFPLLARLRRVLDGTDAFDATQPLHYDADPSFTPGSNELVTVKYADELVSGGVASASTGAAGKSKISVTPSDPSDPIAVGDNDPRVPTQAENDAMAGGGLFGAPSSSNKFRTESYGKAAVVQTYNANATWTKPTGLAYVEVEVWGAGGGGGANNAGGGGGGAYATRRILAADLASTEAVTVGVGGGGGTSSSDGSAGGNSSFGTHLTSYGGGRGGGGNDGSGGGGGGSTSAGGNATGSTAGAGGSPLGGSAGSTSTGGESIFGGGGGGDNGGGGGTGRGGGASYFGGGGGGPSAGGGDGGNSVHGAGGGGGGDGAGGTSVYGGGGGAGGVVNTAGSSGTAPGGGGGGGATSASGGDGAAGRVKVTEYFY